MTPLEAAARRHHDLAVQIELAREDLKMAERSGYPEHTKLVAAHVARLEEERAELARELETLRRGQ